MLTQAEADALFAIPKKPKANDSVLFPHAGGKIKMNQECYCEAINAI